MSFNSGKMIKTLRSGKQLQQQEVNSAEETIPGVKNDARKSTTIAEESEDELYGLALILRNTEDAAKKSNNVSGVPDKEQSSDRESGRREETTGASHYKDKDHFKCCQNINRSLIVHKGFYLFFFSAVGSLFPYLAVFYKQLWLPAHETGILIGIRPLIQVFGTPMWGVIADTYNKSKAIFLLSLVAWLMSNYSLSLVSPVFHLGVCKDNATLGTIQEIIEELKNKTIPEENTTTHHKQSTSKPSTPLQVNPGNSSNHWFDFVGKVTEGNPSKRKTIRLPKHKVQNQVNTVLPVENYENMFRDSTTKINKYLNQKRVIKHMYRFLNESTFHTVNASTMSKLRVRRQSVDIITVLQTSLNNNLTERNKKRLIKTGQYFKLVHNKQRVRRDTVDNSAVMSKSDLEILFRNSSNININEFLRKLNIERIETVFDFLNMAGEYPWPLDTVANYELTQEALEWRNPHDQHLFTILFVITAIGTLIAAPAITLADTATLQNLGKHSKDVCFRVYFLLYIYVVFTFLFAYLPVCLC